ncbi:MAG: glycosyltransferase family 39 protein [Planctomycetaceae bacterium]|nr:glycosyltransferase family 39 protein [Planctomycetaceae bacterium]
MRNDSSAATRLEPPVTRREWFLLVAILLLAAILRFAAPGSFHVEHYDEGVYASNRWFTAEEGARFPDRHLYAPPLWPGILEMSQLVLGTSTLGVMLPGIACGVFSVWLIWRLVRQWMGPEEALFAAAMLALSGYHILFSRTALTDVPVSMFLLWGITAGWRALSTERIGVAIWAGVITGLAWLTKYNGWYPLAVAGAGLAAANLFHVKRSGIAWLRWRCWGVMVVTAIVVWLPAWFDLQEDGRGGYAAVAANHSGYLEGWASWLTNFRAQFENLRWWDLLGSHFGRVSLPMLCLVLTLFGTGIRLQRLIRSGVNREPMSPEILSGWMMVAWVVSLLLMTPLYRPYPRLAMPLMLVLIVGAASGFREIRQLWGRDAVTENSSTGQDVAGSLTRRKVGTMIWGLFVLVASVILVASPVAPDQGGSPWEDRRSMERLSRMVVEECTTLSPGRESAPVSYLIYVYSEPAIYYHLCRLAPRNVLVSPVANLGFLSQTSGREPVPIFLVTGPHAQRNPEFQAQLNDAENSLKELMVTEVEVSDLVSLNLHSPAELTHPGKMFPLESYQLWGVVGTFPD